MAGLASISVDLDTLPHYCRIFSLPETLLDDEARAVVATKAIPRYLELFAQASTPATFFVIGEDVEQAAMRTALMSAAAANVELASHSYSHDYALSRRDPLAVEADLRRADETLRSLGVTPTGFRAPGYTLSAALLEAVEGLGYTYDSSTYPAVPYYLLKATVMAGLEMLRRPSKAILDSPRVLLAPTSPYRPSIGAPYTHGTSRLVELPIAVAPYTRIPFIGAFATSMPWPLVEGVFRSMSSLAHFNFELHAVDVLDASDGIPAELVARQRDLKVRASEKMKRLGRLFSWLGEGRERVTLAEAARRFAPQVSASRVEPPQPT